jgi:hypothetical protein
MSCLFDCIGLYLCVPGSEVRRLICDYLAAERPLLEGISTRQLLDAIDTNKEQYVEHMRLNSTFGTAIEIQAACRLWHCSIDVQNIRDKEGKTISFVNSEYEFNKWTLQWNGNHYTIPARSL